MISNQSGSITILGVVCILGVVLTLSVMTLQRSTASLNQTPPPFLKHQLASQIMSHNIQTVLKNPAAVNYTKAASINYGVFTCAAGATMCQPSNVPLKVIMTGANTVFMNTNSNSFFISEHGAPCTSTSVSSPGGGTPPAQSCPYQVRLTATPVCAGGSCSTYRIKMEFFYNSHHNVELTSSTPLAALTREFTL